MGYAKPGKKKAGAAWGKPVDNTRIGNQNVAHDLDTKKLKVNLTVGAFCLPFIIGIAYLLFTNNEVIRQFYQGLWGETSGKGMQEAMKGMLPLFHTLAIMIFAAASATGWVSSFFMETNEKRQGELSWAVLNLFLTALLVFLFFVFWLRYVNLIIFAISLVTIAVLIITLEKKKNVDPLGIRKR